jgi:type IV pilus assembly protein PilO
MALTMDAVTKLSKTKKIALLAAIVCALVGLYAYLFFLPQKAELDALKGKLNTLKAKISESRTVERDLKTFKDQEAKLNLELTNALAQLPNEKEIPELLKNISTLGKESSLEFTLFKPKPEEPQQFYAKVPIELVALGSYHNTGMFFDRVSKLQRIVNVVDFNMTRAKEVKGREGDVLVQSSCLVNTYRFVEKKPEEKKGPDKTGGEKKGEKK